MEVTQAALSRLDEVEEKIHAFCTPGHELAKEMAASVDAKIARGEDPGVLAGVPIGVKDLVSTKRLATCMGSNIYKGFSPEEDDVVVERLVEAGAVIVGKTNVPEMGYSGVGHSPAFETTRNPWNLDMTPGGSSAGSAASVACGVTPFAIGSDGGGSIRIPAAHCGLYGFKASFGRVPLYPGCRDPRYPGMSSWESLECIGPISRTVDDAALMLSVIAGPDPRDRLSIPKVDFDWMEPMSEMIRGKKVAFSADWGYAAVDPEVRKIAAKAASVFESELDCQFVEAHPGWKEDPFGAFWGLVAKDSDLKGMRAWLPDHAHHMSPHLVDFLQKDWQAEDFTDAAMERQALSNAMAKFMAEYDLLLTPTLAVPPFPVHTQGPEKVDGRIVHPTQWLCFTFPINMTGQPAASVPAGFTRDGLPVGLQIVGRHLDDNLVLQASRAYEEVRPWAQNWPPLLNV